MSVIPKIHHLEEHYNGSTFSPVKFKFNFSVLGAEVICKIRNASSLEVVYEWLIGKNITVVDVEAGEVVLEQIDGFQLPEGNYVYDIKIIFADGNVQTYLKGEVPIQF
jgi:hypothetical protein